MNIIDLLFIIVFCFCLFLGWKRGFLLGTVNLIIWLGSLAGGLLLYRYTSKFLTLILPSIGVWSLPLAFLLTVFLIKIILTFLCNRFLEATSASAHQNGVNHAFGIFPGMINGLIYDTLLAGLLLTLPLSNMVSDATRNSKFANKLGTNVQWLAQKLGPIFNPAVQKAAGHFTIEPESGETVSLHFTVKNAVPREDLEKEMLDLVNKERLKAGLHPLKADPELVPVARAHSDDMFKRGYFSHYTPEKKDPFDRMKEGHIKFFSAGENLALGQTLPICHEGLMNSPGHRANILNTSFNRVGIGIMDGGLHGLMIAQEFRN